MNQNEHQTEYNSDRIQSLIKDLMGTEAMAREKARLALVEIGRPAVDYLIELAYSEKDIWRWEAVKALGQMVELVTVPILIDALEDHNGGVRWLAADGLSRLGPDVVQPLMKVLIERPKSVFLHQGVHHVLYKLKEDLELNGVISAFLEKLKTPTIHANVLVEAKKIIKYFENLSKQN